MERTPSFGDWVRRCRKALDLTQVDLARQVGCAVATIKKVEGDERRPSRQIAQRLADQLGLPPEQHTAFIHAARAELGVDRLAPAPPLAVRNASVPRAARTTNLPSPPTALIGRAQDVATVRTQLAGARLLTLTGPGGIGKTRLAQQVAAELIDAFPDGVYFVDLAPLRTPALVSSAMAQTLEIKETGGQSLVTQLKQFLGDKCMLLLLDNFEHLLDAAPLLAELLATASRLKLLITSRERLHLRGEQEVVVPPLALPEHTTLPLERLTQYAAIALFSARGVDARSDFQITHANAAAVAEICTRLEGMPLAIELAAARLKLFAPEALLARLSSRLALLTGGARDLPVRQQTIRNTIAWSYGLLSGAEQTLFRRLGIFVGGCTLEAINAVCAAVDDQQRDLFEEVTALVDKSLLRQVERSDGAARFVLLETLREYALEQLEASGEAERLRQLHARYYLTLGEVVFPDSPSIWHPARTAQLDRDYDNLWSALDWSQTTAGDAELALRLTGALRILWFHRGMWREAIAALERALTHPHGVGRTLAHATARFNLGQFLGYTGDYASALIQFEQAAQLAQEVGDHWWYAVALEHMGNLAREQGDSATAWARLTESLALLRTRGYAAGIIAEVLNMLAGVAILDEDPVQAEALLAECRAIEQRENHDRNVIGWTLLTLGHAAQLRGAFDHAMQLHHESLACFQAFGDQHHVLPWAYHGLGETALGQGRLGEAERHLAQGLALSQTLGDQASIAWCLAGLGSVAALDEAPERAARLWGAAERLRQAIGCRPAPAARTTYERALVVASAQLGDAAFATAWAAGRALTLEQAVAYALGESDVSDHAANMEPMPTSVTFTTLGERGKRS